MAHGHRHGPWSVDRHPMRHLLPWTRFVVIAGLAWTAMVAAPSAQEPVKPDFSTQSELVVLHVAVKDRKGGYVGGLGQDSFRVIEDKRPQTISFFNSQDAPVTVGLVIDASGSMAPNRDMVIAASMAFSKAMNPQDEFFVMGFNEEIHTPLPPDKPFTSYEPTLRVALVQAIKARGQTAIYNAINAGLDYVQKGGFERQVLIVLSDGGDNASAVTRAQVLANAQASNAVIYSIALVDPMDSEADPGFLKQLSESTGGVAFRPKNAAAVQDILQQVARDIRNMYTLGYVPSEQADAARPEALRRVAVDVRLPTGQKLAVRTRRAVMTGEDGTPDDER
jgi:Ca-activated chloride channel family protein